MTARRTLNRFAVVPAAGASRRMGRPKLLLPWRSSTVIQCVLEAWMASEVDRVILVLRDGDAQLAEIGRRCGADTLLVPPPREMKDSVRHALQHLRDRYVPDESAWWLLSPADYPRLSAEVINRVCRACEVTGAEVVVPCVARRRAHPVALRWSLAAEVDALGPGEGVNALLARHRLEQVELNDPAMLEDLDTPDDYERLK